MAQVILENVEKVYPGGVKAVDAVNLTIADGEFVVLVGPSGCGKSTTLRMVAGLEEITSGTIRIGDRVVNDVAPKDRDIAMVFQNYALYPHMTVYKNMAFGLMLRRKHAAWDNAVAMLAAPTRYRTARSERAEIDRKVHEAAALLGIESLLRRRPAALSGGQRQRVAVGRAIVREPKAFLFDEPLSNLDAKLRVELRAEIRRIHRRLRTTTIYVTHDQEEALALGDRVVVMKDGRIQQVDAPVALYERPANHFVAGFVGTMNFLKGRIARDAGGLVFDDGEQRLKLSAKQQQQLAPLAERPIVLGVRPDALQPAATAVPGTTLAANLALVQPLGDRTELQFSTSRHPHLVCRIATGAFPAREGQPIDIQLDMRRVQFFESEGEGRSVCPADGAPGSPAAESAAGR